MENGIESEKNPSCESLFMIYVCKMCYFTEDWETGQDLHKKCFKISGLKTWSAKCNCVLQLYKNHGNFTFYKF